MSAVRKIQDEPTAVGLPAEIPEAPGMGPTAPVLDYGAVGPGRGASICRCKHSRDDHRPRGGECLDDDCECKAFVRRTPYRPSGNPMERPTGPRSRTTRRHAAMIVAYVDERLSSTAVGQRFGISREAVCAVLRKAGVIRRPVPRGPRVRGAA